MGNVTFAFFDESVSEGLDIASLTATLVPAEKYADVRDRVARLAESAVQSLHPAIGQGHELHGVAMLKDDPDATDDDRFRVFETMVEIVNSERLEIISIGYTNWSDLKLLREMDDKLHGLNFHNIAFALQPLLAEGLLVPIVDGLPGGILDRTGGPGRPQRIEPQIFRAFIASVHSTHRIRVGLEDRGAGDVISIKGYRNLVEPTFTDSASSPLIQLADVVSYLLTMVDTAERRPCTGFKGRLVEIAGKLDPTLVKKWRGKMNMMPAREEQRATPPP
jgi:hypothetical protein